MVTNILGVFTPNMHFVYVLPFWEGSVADGQVLRDAIRSKKKWVLEEDVMLVACMVNLYNVGIDNMDM
ncbi:hypothetical protein Goshw_027707 [Gossypium schwendimanii]|uniref:Uncharacterized protein n=1 Tax=Gossypium schwendimanii TaxID=34291 RepID=A0A7J9N0L9_GOSSC|nr:hypothetical protein [Gossypium schwendimanii]